MRRNIKAQIRTKKTKRFKAFIRSHRAQIRMSETIAVMFIFFVLIVFGIIFYYKYSQIAFKEQQEELLGARAIDTTLKAIYLPELICSRGEAESEDYCFDMMKLRQVNKTFSDHFGEYYFDLFPYTTIKVEQLYPYEEDAEGNNKNKWTLYDKEKPVWERKEATHFVVTLRDESNPGGVYSFGVLTVEVYN